MSKLAPILHTPRAQLNILILLVEGDTIACATCSPCAFCIGVRGRTESKLVTKGRGHDSRLGNWYKWGRAPGPRQVSA